eukprot:TRINITY_DN1180_c0_g1_i2.p1 TRINITY_DN1180_c0_g1~~TRINITY_DN1180_c0_g1_i2.p1  ORF type:complete len:361 (+),score=41.29 TRINITY_DN1180_c0_g1_i2:90-1085(+)
MTEMTSSSSGEFETENQTPLRSGEGVPPTPLWKIYLPTAWIHLVVVEHFHVYTAIYAWLRLIKNVNTHTALHGQYANIDEVEGYFSSLFTWGSTDSLTIHFSNVTDPYFLGGDYQQILFNGSSLTLPATNIAGANIPWLILLWTLPIGACGLLLFVLGAFLMEGIWSFESAAYLQFTWQITREPLYRYCVAVMTIAPLVLPVIWIVQIVYYDLENQIAVLKGSALSGVLLLFSLNLLAFPSVPYHDWCANERFQALRFRRNLLHLFLGRNATFGMKLVDGLWAAQNGDPSRLERYLQDTGQVADVLRICQQAQQSENELREVRTSLRRAEG